MTRSSIEITAYFTNHRNHDSRPVYDQVNFHAFICTTHVFEARDILKWDDVLTGDINKANIYIQGRGYIRLIRYECPPIHVLMSKLRDKGNECTNICPFTFWWTDTETKDNKYTDICPSTCWWTEREPKGNDVSMSTHPHHAEQRESQKTMNIPMSVHLHVDEQSTGQKTMNVPFFSQIFWEQSLYQIYRIICPFHALLHIVFKQMSNIIMIYIQ